jgi:hypothetical protein
MHMRLITVLLAVVTCGCTTSHAQERLGCTWSEHASGTERPINRTCPAGQAIAGIRSVGSFSDKVAVYCCPLPLPPTAAPPPGTVPPPAPRWGVAFSEENGGKSPGPAFVDGIQCKGKHCDWMALRPTYLLNPGGQCTRKSPVSEEEPEGAVCDSRQFVAQMTCHGRYCDSIELKCCSVAGERPPRQLTLGAVGSARYLASQESRMETASCPAGYALRGLKCSGSYCGRVTAICQLYTLDDNPSESREWSYQFSEESNAQARTGAWSDTGFASGVGCGGSYCDRMNVQLLTTPRLQRGTCKRQARFSEEQGEDMCPLGQLVRGIQCYGRYCDEISITCCVATPRE